MGFQTAKGIHTFLYLFYILWVLIAMLVAMLQIYDDTEEGRKVCTYYHLTKMPTTLVIDPITGQKMRAWNGMTDPEQLLYL